MNTGCPIPRIWTGRCQASATGPEQRMASGQWYRCGRCPCSWVSWRAGRGHQLVERTVLQTSWGRCRWESLRLLRFGGREGDMEGRYGEITALISNDHQFPQDSEDFVPIRFPCVYGKLPFSSWANVSLSFPWNFADWIPVGAVTSWGLFPHLPWSFSQPDGCPIRNQLATWHGEKHLNAKSPPHPDSTPGSAFRVALCKLFQSLNLTSFFWKMGINDILFTE